MREKSYQIAFGCAILLHIALLVILATKSTNTTPVLKISHQTHLSKSQELSEKDKTIKAVSVNSEEVLQAVNKIKEARARKQHAEQKRQLAYKKQAEEAKRQRRLEQQKLAKLKREQQRIEKERKKQAEAEKKKLQSIARQKREEEKRLHALKQQQKKLEKVQEQETRRLAALKKKKAEEAELEAQKQQRIDAERAVKKAQRKEQIAGEVNKYKALIINAISRQWILPGNIDESLSSQFRIRLAPTGAVLEVSLTRSSGDPVLDRSAQSAIYKASPLPVPEDPEAFHVFRDIRLTVRPENARG